jgi:hypothetical protein
MGVRGGAENSGGCVLRNEKAIFEGVSFALAEEMLREAGEMRIVARGETMLPAIYPEEELILYRVRLRDVCVGDVVLFTHKNEWHLERVREILPGVTQACLLMREDAGRAREAPVFAEELLGRVAFVVRDGQVKVLPRRRTPMQGVLGCAVSRLPGVARGCLAWRQWHSRLANLRHGAADLLAGRLGGSV